MKITIKITDDGPVHTRFTIFMNGGNCGSLCMRSGEALVFFNALQTGADAANLLTEYTNYEGKLFSDSDTSYRCFDAEDAKVHRGSRSVDEGMLRSKGPPVRATAQTCESADVRSEKLLTKKPITKEDFEFLWTRTCGMTRQMLIGNNLVVEKCNCGHEDCLGWEMKHKLPKLPYYLRLEASCHVQE